MPPFIFKANQKVKRSENEEPINVTMEKAVHPKILQVLLNLYRDDVPDYLYTRYSQIYSQFNQRIRMVSLYLKGILVYWLLSWRKKWFKLTFRPHVNLFINLPIYLIIPSLFKVYFVASAQKIFEKHGTDIENILSKDFEEHLNKLQTLSSNQKISDDEYKSNIQLLTKYDSANALIAQSLIQQRSSMQ